MKYSLRSLMIVVAVGCVVLATVLLLVRGEYMRQCALFHEREAKKTNSLFDAIEHNLKAGEYREAIFRPWKIVLEDEP